MARISSLAEAVKSAIHDGDTIALEGFTHLIPHAAGHEIIRQGRKNLTLIRMTPDLVYDQLIGMGCVAKLVFSWGGNPGVGSLHRLRDAVENGWPHKLELEEHSHAAMANAYEAGAAGLPCAIFRGYIGGDLPKVNSRIKRVTCPFTGEELAAVPAHRPDVAVIHAQRADKAGNVMIEGVLGVQKEAVLASKRSVVTVEEIVDCGIGRHRSCRKHRGGGEDGEASHRLDPTHAPVGGQRPLSALPPEENERTAASPRTTNAPAFHDHEYGSTALR